MTKYRVILIKGKVRWYYNLEATNGQVLTTSQRYYSKSNAHRAAKTLANGIGADLIIGYNS